MRFHRVLPGGSREESAPCGPMADTELLSYAGGPPTRQLPSGSVAAVTGRRCSLAAGGLACVAAQDKCWRFSLTPADSPARPHRTKAGTRILCCPVRISEDPRAERTR